MNNTPNDTAGIRRTMLAGTVGTVMEWYDFTLYGLASALVFGPLFFGSTDIGATLASFATFAIGFAARPIGGALSGHLGDRIGRKRVLLATLLTMGAATTLIGTLPTRATAGLWAPLLLILLRICQGIAVGGEFVGAVLLTVENAPAGRRGLYGSVPAMGTGAGFVLASAVFGTVSLLPDDAFLTWGWRIPFLLSIALIAFGLWLRRSIDETPAFTDLAQRGATVRYPLATVLREHPGAVARVMGITVSGFIWGYLIQAFALSYATKNLHIPRSTMLWAITLASALEIAAIPFWGRLSDRIGRRATVTAGLACTAAYAYPFFRLLETRSTPVILIALIGAIPLCKDMVFGPQPALVAEQFDARIRFSGVSIGREFGGALFGGTAPFIATALVAGSHSITPVVLYVIAGCAVTALAVLTGRETAHGEIRDT
ncbi:MFS transporter [Streptomyces sp. BE20]|uniref:MFS transporter n=1 Tax=unclassified Streptomyces TaxID=2593676 RepID=UPI002E77AAF6|nr:MULTISPECIES: MFS transporter [unclassified Streptomyces]MED7947450.1 MFS transporter [Streptomyces sp. BE303]MEE1822951.1 MFS transporter [Streptomyces sp. BE20]